MNPAASTPVVPEAALREAARTQAYFPYRRVWISLAADGAYTIVAKATAHTANSLARKGFAVFELTKGTR